MRSMASLVVAYAEHLSPLFDWPFAFFGHSMGALAAFELAAFELARLRRRRGGSMPVRLLLSGDRAAHLLAIRPAISPLAPARFFDRLRQMSAGPRSAVLKPELVELLDAMTRTDFLLCEWYAYRPEAPLDVPITGFAAVDDPEVDVAEAAAWRHRRRRLPAALLPGRSPVPAGPLGVDPRGHRRRPGAVTGPENRTNSARRPATRSRAWARSTTCWSPAAWILDFRAERLPPLSGYQY